LLTQFTSFVAVEEVKITQGGQARTVGVPVEMPEGVSYEGVFGGRGGAAGERALRQMAPAQMGYAPLPRASLSMRAADGGIRYKAKAAPAEEPARAADMARPVSPPTAPRLGRASGPDIREFEAPNEAHGSPGVKLAPELRGLAAKVAKEGKDGNLTIGKIQVKDGRIEVRVQLTALSDEALAKLKALGFQELAQAKSVKLVIGTIDVKQLEALAKLDVVRRIEPSP
jgi:hypothetical protein